MKRALILIVALLFTSLALSAQSYLSFPASNALWTIRQGNYDLPPLYFCYGLKGGDTILSGKSYHKLYRSTDSVLSESEYWGGIREDSMKRVYFTTSGMTGETLLYDFSLGIGDTIKAFGPVGIVSFIDSISIGGQYRRRLNFRTPDGTAWPFGAWIEGLGNSALGGLLNSPMAQPTCDCAANLICFRQNGVWLYHNPHQTTDCFGATLRINEVTPVSALTIIPNPVNGTAHIHITGSQTFTRLIVYGLNGNLVLNADVTNKREFVLNSSGLPAGLYCYRLYHENGLGLTGKFSIQ